MSYVYEPHPYFFCLTIPNAGRVGFFVFDHHLCVVRKKKKKLHLSYLTTTDGRVFLSNNSTRHAQSISVIDKHNRWARSFVYFLYLSFFFSNLFYDTEASCLCGSL